MEEMKTRIFLVSALLAIPAMMQAQTAVSDPQGAMIYSLPMTSVKLEIEASRESFYAGPYAKYAQKYLGIDADIYPALPAKTCPYSAAKAMYDFISEVKK